MRLFVHSLARSIVRSFVRSFVLSFIHSLACSFVRSFVRSLARYYLFFAHSLVRSSLHGKESTATQAGLCEEE